MNLGVKMQYVFYFTSFLNYGGSNKNLLQNSDLANFT